MQVMQLLDRLYTKFDQLVAQYELFKVETIGAEQCCLALCGPTRCQRLFDNCWALQSADNTQPDCACSHTVTT